MSGFSVRLQELMESRQLSVLDLAERTGLSRQAIYKMLQTDFDPLSQGVRKVARAIEVDPTDLLPREDDPTAQIAEVLALVHRAAAEKDARAFEVLPAALAALDPTSLARLHSKSDLEMRLLAAAAAMAAELTSNDNLGRLAESWGQTEDPYQGFFFGGPLADVERSVASTPEPLCRHRVFGSFSTDLFRRHLRNVGVGATITQGTEGFPTDGRQDVENRNARRIRRGGSGSVALPRQASPDPRH